MTDTPLLLAGDFATPSAADWEVEVLKVLNRRRPEGTELTVEQAMARLRTTTADGLRIEPLYTESDIPLGHPGVMPFTRGTMTKTSPATGWDVRQLHEDPDAAYTKAQILADLERGATSVWLRLGSDAIAPSDLAAVLDEVDPNLAPISVSSVEDQVAAAKALADYLAAKGAHHAAGSFGLDALGAAARTGAAADLGPQAEWVAKALAEFPGVRALTVDALPYDDAGAGDIDQLAFAIATGVAYLRDLEAAGISPEKAFGQFAFRVSANTDQFTTIARLRALRRLWARVGEVSGVPANARGAVQHAVTSWRMITRDDPWVNLLRGTIATFAAAVGGAEIVTTLPFDTAWGLPNEVSRRLARNTQLVAAEESNIGRVADPAGGSWYVEQLTDQLANKAWATFVEIEAAGGMAAALSSGLVADKIAGVSTERAKRLSTRKLPLTGVSMFPKADEEPVKAKPRPAAPARAGLPAHRDAEVFEALRDRAAAAPSKPEVFLACLGARRDFGGRETFTAALLGVGGIVTPSSEGGTPEEIAAKASAAGAKFVILCSSAKIYADQAVPVARALKAAGVGTVYIAGRKKETGAADVDDVIDGEVFDGMDVVAFLGEAMDRMGVAK
ncbi:heterodimeric methylmalonyl-CoA mutase small subunit [Propionicimonas paludicola]|uniref:Heterodimeric methylmalonyl-CoA mutase small subunit n=1 Tax=Propionicimonas paludicola TaxID=185243 RepID=A0A2A9CN58_9ACTN|nr:methylmalonyl-CoA mutase family protein [Propionicimonas paludicola]PFG15854.1 heterodimeric methylmalonyl-CoA mutase small subunit [Propionicimonas paludicola]